MRPSQFNLIRRMCIRMSRQRYYEKVAKKNRKKKQKLLILVKLEAKLKLTLV